MPISRRFVVTAAVVAAVLAVAAYLVLVRWQPENQVRRAHHRWIEAVAAGNRDRFAAPVADDYADAWGFTREDVVTAIREASRQFFSLSAEWTEAALVLGEDERVATVTGTIRLQGRGNLIGEEILTRVNRLEDPFTFEWRRASWKPWDWQLVRIAHPKLRVPDDYSPGELGGF